MFSERQQGLREARAVEKHDFSDGSAWIRIFCRIRKSNKDRKAKRQQKVVQTRIGQGNDARLSGKRRERERERGIGIKERQRKGEGVGKLLLKRAHTPHRSSTSSWIKDRVRSRSRNRSRITQG